MLPQSEFRPTNTEYESAAYITGCLIQQGFVKIIKPAEIDGETMENVVRLIAACLRDLRADGDDIALLPFTW